ncbi:MAG: D-aminoacylase [Candidimonas sp.]|nr:MAG: D-aminoacylase [Candidimonas sp.]TAM25747.1 MAG: D-aminoacylase [Candidimonas sp.]TAM74046.1 MAG: D-aminoacylase [Candidimonas sp.]
MLDTVLEGGTVHDGHGGQGFIADVGILNGRIEVIGALKDTPAAERITINGLVVAPGFVDMHTHSDFTLVVNGKAESQVHQGVTTEVTGQCGMSCAPVTCDHDIKAFSPGHTEGAGHHHWRSFGEYLNVLESNPLGVNVVAFVGHGTIVRSVLGDQMRAGDPDEIDQMVKILEEAIEQGAGGFSTGLEYWPGIVSSPEHIVPLCEVAARHNRLYATHVRNRDIYYDLGFGEALATARQSGAKLQISHIQPKFGAPRHAMEHTFEMIDAARRRGLDVAFDVVPHDWNHTTVMQILPQWARVGGPAATIERLKNRELRERIKKNPRPMWLLVRARRWEDIVLLDCTTNRNLVGANFQEIGRIRGTDPYDALFDLLIEEGENASRMLWTSHSFTDDDIVHCLRQPECAVISDTQALAPYGVLKDHIGSLSGYGWAARFLQHYVRDLKVLPLGDAIRRVTSLPAERVGLIDRGAIRPGFCADIVVFDAESITSHCSVSKPREYATGISHVMVNGELAMRDGQRTDRNAGKILRNFN